MKRFALDTDPVKKAMADIVNDKMQYYKHTLKLDVDENSIAKEVYDEAKQSLGVIMADFNPNALRFMANNMMRIFKQVYEKIVVNEHSLAGI